MEENESRTNSQFSKHRDRRLGSVASSWADVAQNRNMHFFPYIIQILFSCTFITQAHSGYWVPGIALVLSPKLDLKSKFEIENCEMGKKGEIKQPCLLWIHFIFRFDFATFRIVLRPTNSGGGVGGGVGKKFKTKFISCLGGACLNVLSSMHSTDKSTWCSCPLFMPYVDWNSFLMNYMFRSFGHIGKLFAATFFVHITYTIHTYFRKAHRSTLRFERFLRGLRAWN